MTQAIAVQLSLALHLGIEKLENLRSMWRSLSSMLSTFRVYVEPWHWLAMTSCNWPPLARSTKATNAKIGFWRGEKRHTTLLGYSRSGWGGKAFAYMLGIEVLNKV
eukprot:scaffold176150_cov21-Tisochrysis_lutea.AAC.1